MIAQVSALGERCSKHSPAADHFESGGALTLRSSAPGDGLRMDGVVNDGFSAEWRYFSQEGQLLGSVKHRPSDRTKARLANAAGYAARWARNEELEGCPPWVLDAVRIPVAAG
jgi:hypothetical protein